MQKTVFQRRRIVLVAQELEPLSRPGAFGRVVVTQSGAQRCARGRIAGQRAEDQATSRVLARAEGRAKGLERLPPTGAGPLQLPATKRHRQGAGTGFESFGRQLAAGKLAQERGDSDASL